MKNSLYSLILLGLLSACDPCPECGTPLLSEPTVNMKFINLDSVNIINDSLSFFTINDSILNANVDSLAQLRDSLKIVVDSIENGGELSLEEMNLEQWISDRQQDSLLYSELNKDADSLTALLTNQKSTINSGLITIQSLMLRENGETILLNERKSNWAFPLLYDFTTSSYEFELWDESFFIELAYETFTEVDEERKVKVRAKNIQILDFKGFDSIDQCEQNCLDGQTTFTFYF